jgi:hypothetical protein
VCDDKYTLGAGFRGSKSRLNCCPSGSFMSHPFLTPFFVAHSCSVCPSDSSSSFTDVENDEISCNGKCPELMYYDGIGCQDCPAGKIGSSAGICTDCALGMYSILPASLKCENCLGGKTTVAEGGSKTTDCLDCEPGTYSDPGASCVACPSGWGGTDVKSYCIECMAGKFKTTTICEDCPINTYTDEKAQISTCKDCDDAANSVKGSSVCVKCDVGQYMPAGNDRSCLDCEPGQYSNYGKVQCTECGQGYYADKTIAATGCKSCPSGQYGRQYGSGAEVAQRINEGDACDECGSGKYSKAKGADSVGTCIDCQPGKKATDVVAATEETDACTNCLVGQYRPSQIIINGVMTNTELTKCK